MVKDMNKKQKQELAGLERKILKLVNYVDGRGVTPCLSDCAKEKKKELEGLLIRRYVLLNEMFQCTPEEVEAFKKVNERLEDLTKKMHAKTIALFRSILQEGYDPGFDDDIMVEASIRYVYNDEYTSVILDDVLPNLYGSDFPHMLDILYDYYEDSCWPECASCNASYSLRYNPDMAAKEFGLEDFLSDGKTWAESWLLREEFKKINICHAVHDLCLHKHYSIPDLLRMNDFWIEVKITHQHVVDRDGKRYSWIEYDKEE